MKTLQLSRCSTPPWCHCVGIRVLVQYLYEVSTQKFLRTYCAYQQDHRGCGMKKGNLWKKWGKFAKLKKKLLRKEVKSIKEGWVDWRHKGDLQYIYRRTWGGVKYIFQKAGGGGFRPKYWPSNVCSSYLVHIFANVTCNRFILVPVLLKSRLIRLSFLRTSRLSSPRWIQENYITLAAILFLSGRFFNIALAVFQLLTGLNLSGKFPSLAAPRGKGEIVVMSFGGSSVAGWRP